jgi:hypothetical protein
MEQEKRREHDKSKGRSTHFWGAPLLFNPDSERRLDTEMSARQAIDTGDDPQIIANRTLCKSRLRKFLLFCHTRVPCDRIRTFDGR